MTYQRKTRDTYELWLNYCHGWEHEITEFTLADIRQRQKEYSENCPEYPTKIKTRREPISQHETLEEARAVAEAIAAFKGLTIRSWSL